jgi:hypothetical protein
MSVEKTPRLRSPAVFQQLRRMPQGGETEEWSGRLVAKRNADSRDAFLDFVDPFLLAQLR